MPRLRSAVPTFLVNDVEETAAWYARHLGFTASFFPKTAPYAFASLARDGIEIMLLRLDGYRKPAVVRAAGHWDAYIRMEGVREFYESVRRSIPIKMELKEQPYGDTEFEIEDPNGYVLVFSE